MGVAATLPELSELTLEINDVTYIRETHICILEFTVYVSSISFYVEVFLDLMSV